MAVADEGVPVRESRRDRQRNRKRSRVGTQIGRILMFGAQSFFAGLRPAPRQGYRPGPDFFALRAAVGFSILQGKVLHLMGT